MPRLRRSAFTDPVRIPAVDSPIRLKEADVLRQVRAYLRMAGWFSFRIQQGSMSYPGIADLCAIRQGVTLWIELKSQRGGKQSPDQVLFQQDLERAGGHYLIVQTVQQLEHMITEILHRYANKMQR